MTEGGHGGGPEGGRAVPYFCPFCGEEDLRPADPGRWHCRCCLRLFSLGFHGVSAATSAYPAPASGASVDPPAPTPTTGIPLVDLPATGHDDPTNRGSTR